MLLQAKELRLSFISDRWSSQLHEIKENGEDRIRFRSCWQGQYSSRNGVNRKVPKGDRISGRSYRYAIHYADILVTENYPKPEEVAELYSTLSEYFEKIGNSEKSLTCIQKVKTLYEELYSPEDKRVIKARRKIATALLKSERYKEAVTELL